jgi:hypothetical protein
MSRFESMSHTSPLKVSSPFGDSLDTGGVRREGESSGSGEFRIVSVGDISCPVESAVEPVIVSVQPVVPIVEFGQLWSQLLCRLRMMRVRLGFRGS